MYTLQQICAAVEAALDDRAFSERLRRPYYRNRQDRGGFCYIASEAIYHLAQEYDYPGLRVCHMQWENDSHWFLWDTLTAENIDVTVNQFDSIPDYARADFKYFMHPSPSKRAQKLIARAKQLLAPEFYTKPISKLEYNDIPR